MAKVFISYRRKDDPGAARGINDAMVKKFGKKNVYFDLDTLRAGLDWREQIDEMVALCNVMLVVIGDKWLQADESGRSRLENADDLVRIEVSSALKRDIPVIPVLVGNAELPTRDSIPEEINQLIYRQAVEVRATSKVFYAEIENLIQNIEVVVPEAAPSVKRLKWRYWKIAIVPVVVGIGIVSAGIYWEPWRLRDTTTEEKSSLIAEVQEEGMRVKNPEEGLKVNEQDPVVHKSTEKSKFVAGQYFQDCEKCPVMVVIPAGNFLMGGTEKNERPQHRVNVGKFAISEHELTFDEYDAFANSTGMDLPDDNGWGRGKKPVINVTWNDAQKYIKWLSTRTGKHYRLPSEAEWEYAARAGTITDFWWGDTIGRNRANCDGCDNRMDVLQTVPIGFFPANPFGLHDTAGNVAEWVEDCWYENYDSKERPDDGSAWLKSDADRCSYSVIRGGAWFFTPQHLRSASRSSFPKHFRNHFIGFRVARDLD